MVRLALAQARLLRRPPIAADAMIVGYPGHLDLLAARRAARGAPVVFNPLVSLVDTLVGDRGRFRPESVSARLLAAVDRRACAPPTWSWPTRRPTQSSFAELAGLADRHFAVCFVGAEERRLPTRLGAARADHSGFRREADPASRLETILGAARFAPSCDSE